MNHHTIGNKSSDYVLYMEDGKYGLIDQKRLIHKKDNKIVTDALFSEISEIFELESIFSGDKILVKCKVGNNSGVYNVTDSEWFVPPTYAQIDNSPHMRYTLYNVWNGDAYKDVKYGLYNTDKKELVIDLKYTEPVVGYFNIVMDEETVYKFSKAKKDNLYALINFQKGIELSEPLFENIFYIKDGKAEVMYEGKVMDYVIETKEIVPKD